MDLVVRGGTVVTPTRSIRADVGIANGTIAAVGEIDDRAPALDASGMLVLPGAIDVHTHLRLPTEEFPDRLFEDTAAAACGGTTTVLTFIEQLRGGSPLETLERWTRATAPEAAVDYGFQVVLTDLSERAACEMPELIARGCPTFKAFMVYPELRIDDRELFRALGITAAHHGMMMVHCENLVLLEAGIAAHLRRGEIAPRFHASSRPPLVEAEATHRALCLARAAGAPVYVVHLSCREALRSLQEARKDGQSAYAETCPHYLTLSAECYEGRDEETARFVISPPLREASQRDDLWRALATGDLDVVGSDHVPRRIAAEQANGVAPFPEIPNGAPGIETLVSLVYDGGVAAGRISAERMVELLAATPARLFGLESKGAIEVGKDADLVIWDPARERTLSQARLHHSADFTPYEGRTIRGGPVATMVRGRVVAEDGRFVGPRGFGTFRARFLR